MGPLDKFKGKIESLFENLDLDWLMSDNAIELIFALLFAFLLLSVIGKLKLRNLLFFALLGIGVVTFFWVDSEKNTTQFLSGNIISNTIPNNTVTTTTNIRYNTVTTTTNIRYNHQDGLNYYKQRNFIKAREIWLDLSKQGDAKSQASLGTLYYNGRGVTKDYEQAFYWIQKSAEQGYSTAQNIMGTMYVEGRGAAQDYKKAVYWYRKAAEQDYPYAQFNLGIKYEKGLGVEKDAEQALYWFNRAAQLGSASAKNKLKAIEKSTILTAVGTGFVVEKNGVIATSYHVVDRCKRIIIENTEFTLLDKDIKNDLALLKADKHFNSYSSISIEPPYLGDDVQIFGFPLTKIFTKDNISLTKGSINSLVGYEGNPSQFRFDAAVQPGNSGGPIVNNLGKVVGIAKSALRKADGRVLQLANFGVYSTKLVSLMSANNIPISNIYISQANLVKHYVNTTKLIECYL